MEFSHRHFTSLSDVIKSRLNIPDRTWGYSLIERLYGLQNVGKHRYKILLVNDEGQITDIGAQPISANLDMVRDQLNTKDNTVISLIKLVDGPIEDVFVTNKVFRENFKNKLFLLECIPTLEGEMVCDSAVFEMPRSMLLDFIYNEVPDPEFYKIAKMFLVGKTPLALFKGHWREVLQEFGNDSKRILEDELFQSLFGLLSINISVDDSVVTIADELNS